MGKPEAGSSFQYASVAPVGEDHPNPHAGMVSESLHEGFGIAARPGAEDGEGNQNQNQNLRPNSRLINPRPFWKKLSASFRSM